VEKIKRVPCCRRRIWLSSDETSILKFHRVTPVRCRCFVVGTRRNASAARPGVRDAVLEWRPLPVLPGAFHCDLAKKFTPERLSPGDRVRTGICGKSGVSRCAGFTGALLSSYQVVTHTRGGFCYSSGRSGSDRHRRILPLLHGNRAPGTPPGARLFLWQIQRCWRQGCTSSAPNCPRKEASRSRRSASGISAGVGEPGSICISSSRSCLSRSQAAALV